MGKITYSTIAVRFDFDRGAVIAPTQYNGMQMNIVIPEEAIADHLQIESLNQREAVAFITGNIDLLIEALVAWMNRTQIDHTAEVRFSLNDLKMFPKPDH